MNYLLIIIILTLLAMLTLIASNLAGVKDKAFFKKRVVWLLIVFVSLISSVGLLLFLEKKSVQNLTLSMKDEIREDYLICEASDSVKDDFILLCGDEAVHPDADARIVSKPDESRLGAFITFMIKDKVSCKVRIAKSFMLGVDFDTESFSFSRSCKDVSKEDINEVKRTYRLLKNYPLLKDIDILSDPRDRDSISR